MGAAQPRAQIAFRVPLLFAVVMTFNTGGPAVNKPLRVLQKISSLK